MSKKTKREKKELVGVLLLGLGLYYLWFQRSSGGGARRYRLPDGRIVTEDMLPALGYVYYQGYWIPRARLNQVTGQNFSAFNWQQLINSGFSLFEAGMNLWQLIQDAFQANQFDDAILTPTDGPLGPGDEWWV